MISDPVRLGVIGLGRGFALSARGLQAHPGIQLVAGANPSEPPRTAFEATFGGKGYANYKDLLADPSIEMVYVATPHGLHRQHVQDCLNAGKHVVVEKPLTVSLSDAAALVRQADALGLTLMVGPSHSYDAPVARAAELIAGGTIGTPQMMHLLTATDFLYRFRRPEELQTDQGGGVVFSQGVHQVDMAMRLIGSDPVRVYAKTTASDPARPTEGGYTALVTFANGAAASLTYSGYGLFDSDTLMGEVSELGVPKLPESYGAARRALAGAQNEATAKKSRAFTGLDGLPEPTSHEQFGQCVMFCAQGDIALGHDHIRVHYPNRVERLDCPFAQSRAEFADTIYHSQRRGPALVQTGRWGFAALATCHALLASAASGQPEPVTQIDEVPDA